MESIGGSQVSLRNLKNSAFEIECCMQMRSINSSVDSHRQLLVGQCHAALVKAWADALRKHLY